MTQVFFFYQLPILSSLFFIILQTSSYVAGHVPPPGLSHQVPDFDDADEEDWD